MSETTADPAPQESPAPEASSGGGSHFWPDETVDVICGLVVFTCLTLGVLWYVVNG
jgi:hypothetical protein